MMNDILPPINPPPLAHPNCQPKILPMNCLYCNYTCDTPEDGLYYVCSHCYGKPAFCQWNEISYKKHKGLNALFKDAFFFEVSFYSQKWNAYYQPNTNILIIRYAGDEPYHHIQLQETLTPDKLQTIINRLNNLKAFS